MRSGRRPLCSAPGCPVNCNNCNICAKKDKVHLVFSAKFFYNLSMIAVKILDIKNFTAGFLTGTWLDSYELAEGSVTTFCTMTIDGTRQAEFYGADDTEETEEEGQEEQPAQNLVAWKDVRPYCFDFIKGKRLPLAFKFVLFFPHGQIPSFLDHYKIQLDPATVRGLCINLRYDAVGLVLTTGTSISTFTMDKTLDHTWDAYVRAWLHFHKVAFEEM